MSLTCSRCGRVGERGFWVSIQQWPAPNRILCNNGKACDKRVRAREKKAAA